MIYAVCFIIMFIVANDDLFFFYYPVNIWVASFMVYVLHESTILQSGVCNLFLDLARFTKEDCFIIISYFMTVILCCQNRALGKQAACLVKHLKELGRPLTLGTSYFIGS